MKSNKILLVMALSTFLGFICGMVYEEVTKPIEEPEVITQVETRTEKVYVDRPKVVTVEITKEIPKKPETELKQYEKELIAQVVYAEAKWEDMIGKRLVVDSILNRVGKEGFANTIYGVIYQDNQFVKASIFDDECMQAVEMECMERLDENVIWFCNSGYMPYGVPAYQHGNHYFNWIEE